MSQHVHKKAVEVTETRAALVPVLMIPSNQAPDHKST